MHVVQPPGHPLTHKWAEGTTWALVTGYCRNVRLGGAALVPTPHEGGRHLDPFLQAALDGLLERLLLVLLHQPGSADLDDLPSVQRCGPQFRLLWCG